MKISDLVQLLDNRLREFKLSKDYARMSGDLERMNVADKEIIGLEDTLYQLNLLVDISKSAAVKEAILAEVIIDGSVAILGEYDITSYATDPKHEEKIMNILSKMGVMDTVEKIDDYIRSKSLSSLVTGEMIMSAAEAYTVDARLMMAIMEQDSSFGTAGKAVRTLNPGNVGNDDSGNLRTYESWQEGVTAVVEWLSRHRGSTIIPEITEETVLEPATTLVSPTITPPTASTSITTTTTVTTTPSPTTSPSFSTIPTPVVTITPSPTASSSFSPTPTPTPEPTPESTPEPTPTSSPAVSESPAPSPSATPEPTSTPSPTPEPTPEPESTPEATPESTPEATPESTPEFTPEPTDD